MANRKYTEDQRTEAIRLISEEGQSAASVARELSVSVGTVHRWVSDAIAARTPPAAWGGCPESTADWADLDLETQLRCVLSRISELESQMRRLAERERSQEN